MAVITAFLVGFYLAIAAFFKYLLVNVSPSDILLLELGAIILVASFFALFARLIKQPPILAYVIAGFVLGPAALAVVKDIEVIKSFSEIGIAFLLFLAGLEISFKKLKQVNLKKMFVVTTLQVLLVFFLTLFLIKYIGLNSSQGVYVAVALAFSSTMVVVKLLSDKGDLVTMHGRLVLGILLLQDFFAIAAIILLTSEHISPSLFLFAALKVILILGAAFILERFVFRKTFRQAAASPHSKELLLLSSLAVLFAFIMLSIFFKLSIVIGAFIAGVSLANLPFKVELESRVGPLRDFFSILFFVALGMQITFIGVGSYLNLLLFLLVGAFFIKPLITTILIRFSGYGQRTAFISSLALAQLSEFSIIIAVLGFNLGILSQAILSTIILATILTMSFTVFFIDYQNFFYNLFKGPLNLLKFIPIKETLGYHDNEKKKVLLIGCDRMGSIILKELLAEDKKSVLVMDHNPEIISILRQKKISCVYGEVNSPDIFENLPVKDLQKVISTVPDLEEGIILLEKLKKHNKNLTLILTAQTIGDALELYENGADYIMIPRFTAGEVVANILKKDKESLQGIKEGQIQRITKANSILK